MKYIIKTYYYNQPLRIKTLSFHTSNLVYSYVNVALKCIPVVHLTHLGNNNDIISSQPKRSSVLLVLIINTCVCRLKSKDIAVVFFGHLLVIGIKSLAMFEIINTICNNKQIDANLQQS